MVCALKVYDPLCIRDCTLVMSAFSMASGRRPSKLTINTRSACGAGIEVWVGINVSVGSGGALIGLAVVVGMESGSGAEVEAKSPQLERKKHSDVRIQRRRIMFRSFSQASAF